MVFIALGVLGVFDISDEHVDVVWRSVITLLQLDNTGPRINPCAAHDALEVNRVGHGRFLVNLEGFLVIFDYDGDHVRVWDISLAGDNLRTHAFWCIFSSSVRGRSAVSGSSFAFMGLIGSPEPSPMVLVRDALDVSGYLFLLDERMVRYLRLVTAFGSAPRLRT